MILKSSIEHNALHLDYDSLGEENLFNGRFYITPDGNRYPSITTVLSSQDDGGIERWKQRVGEAEATRVSNFAKNRGNYMHDLMEKYIRQEEINASRLLPLYKNSFIRISKILDERLSEWYVQEKQLYSDYLKLAGRIDLAARFDGIRSIVDYKTSGKVKKKEWIDSYFIQETAYSIMLEERTGVSFPNLVIIMDVLGQDPIVFKEHRDNWVKPLMNIISKYYEEN